MRYSNQLSRYNLALSLLSIGIGVCCLMLLAIMYSGIAMKVERLKVENTPDQVTLTSTYENYVNMERAIAGLPRLKHSDPLYRSACNKAQDMIAHNYWSHDSPDGVTPWYWVKNADYQYQNIGENLAKGFAGPKETVQGWMNSPTHKENLLGDYTEQGICAVKGELQGAETTLVVQHLGTPLANVSE